MPSRPWATRTSSIPSASQPSAAATKKGRDGEAGQAGDFDEIGHVYDQRPAEEPGGGQRSA